MSFRASISGPLREPQRTTSLFEDDLRHALSISGGDWSILDASPDSVVLYVLAAVVVAVPVWLGRRRHREAEGHAPTAPAE